MDLVGPQGPVSSQDPLVGSLWARNRPCPLSGGDERQATDKRAFQEFLLDEMKREGDSLCLETPPIGRTGPPDSRQRKVVSLEEFLPGEVRQRDWLYLHGMRLSALHALHVASRPCQLPKN